jgi:hypothetical protein
MLQAIDATKSIAGKLTEITHGTSQVGIGFDRPKTVKVTYQTEGVTVLVNGVPTKSAHMTNTASFVVTLSASQDAKELRKAIAKELRSLGITRNEYIALEIERDVLFDKGDSP